jgi:hypothetical protein
MISISRFWQRSWRSGNRRSSTMPAGSRKYRKGLRDIAKSEPPVTNFVVFDKQR